MTVTLVKCVEMTLLLLLFILIRIAPNNCEVYSNCTFINNEHKNYNFSRLSRQEVWKAGVNERAEFAYISVCRLQNNTQSPCKESAFCVSKDRDGNWNIGLSNTGPYKIKQDDSRKFFMELAGTQPCALDSGRNYSVEIYFTCSSIDQDPIVVGTVSDGCVLLITWETPAACPVIKECVYGNYDLSSLAHPTYYEVSTLDGRSFQLNFCGNLHKSSSCQSNGTNPVTACEVIQRNQSTVIIGQRQLQTLTAVPNSGLTLTYKTKKKGPKTVVKFVCNADAKENTLQFISTDEKTFNFEMETPLACNTFPQECIAFDKKMGGRYDLRSLRMSKDNWVIPSKNQDELYYISVCGPLSAVPNFTAISDGHMEACLVNMRTKIVINLGTVVGGPSMEKDVLTLEYVGGSLCSDGGRHRLEIEFSCSKYDRGPLYIKTTKDCVHYFSWETSVACPTLLDIGKDCRVRELQHGYRYDLNTLRSDMDKWIFSGQNSSFRINLCGPLSDPCGNKNASICLKNGNKDIAIGIEASTPIYEDGGLRIVSHGDACKSGYNMSTVTIILKCNHGPGKGEPELLLGLPNGCDFYFMWQTNVACPPHQFSRCTVEHRGQFYDLSSLTDTMSNHIVVQREQKLKFFLNVCHSVIQGTDAMCEYSSAACMHNMSDPNINTKFINIGDVDVGSGPYVDPDDGKLKIKYQNGKICLDPNGPDHMQTVIIFKCDEEDSVPIPLAGGVCTYEFLWKTRAACPNGKLLEQKVMPNNDCSVVDPLTKDKFDLSPLQNIVKTVSDKVNGHNYTFVVCGNLTNSPCGNTSGVCQEKSDEHWNAGVGNSNLKYQRHALLLEYEDGTPCNKSLKRKTTIEFICADGSSEQVIFVDETKDCTYLISWHTKLACRENYYEDCRSDDIQLEPLIRQEKNYVVKAGNGTVFYINVCKPLLPEMGLGCSGGPSICMAHEKDGKLVDEQNIGFHEKLIKTDEGKVKIVLSNGTSANTTAEIFLECDLTTGIGEPKFQHIVIEKNQSKYDFIWKTNVTCPPYGKHVSPIKDNCVIHNDQINGTLNLKEFGNHGVITVDGKSHKYKVDFCGSGIHAEHSKADFLSNLRGTLTTVTFYYQQRQASLHFTSDSTCSSTATEGTFQSELILFCVPGEEPKKPEVTENNCGIVITWQHPLVCEVLIAGFPHHIPQIKEEENGGTSVGMVIGLVILVILLCSLIVYFRKPSNRSQLKSRITSLLGIRHSAQFHYSRLEAADEASQLLVSHMDGQESDSDDELLRM